MAKQKSKVFYPVGRPLGPDGDPMRNPERIVYTRGLWSDSSGELMTFYTSSTQNTSSRNYYYEVWNSASADCDEVQMFSVAYGNFFGSGSSNSGGESDDTPSRAIYSQYRLMCLDPGTRKFQLASGTDMNHIYVVNFNRQRVGDKLDPGNFELAIAELNGGSFANNLFTGSNVAVSSSNKVITLIDDSGDASDSLGYGGVPSPVRNLVSGSIANGVYNPSSPVYYGLVYADMGTIVISADMLNASASFNTVTGSGVTGDNAMKLFKSISGSAVIGTGFTARAVDIKEHDFYFCRVENGAMNYSNNPTFVSGSDGFLSNSRFENEPTTYITSVGLYDDFGRLLAVAKLSRPVKKAYNQELSFTINLEY